MKSDDIDAATIIDHLTGQLREVSAEKQELEERCSQFDSAESLRVDQRDADTQEVLRLAQLSEIEYERERHTAAERMEIGRVTALDNSVKAARAKLHYQDHSPASELENGIDPWPDPVDGNALAQTINCILRRHVILPSSAAVALTLWIMGSYTIDSFRIFPKLCITSPEKRCGKTTLMEVLAGLVHRALSCSNITTAVIFRVIDLWGFLFADRRG